MEIVEFELSDELRKESRARWHRYLDEVAAFRPDLHRYCRRLTGNLWEAEDLVQDTLVRGFAALATRHQSIRNPRGYLVRIATNLWLDRGRRTQREQAARQTLAETAKPAPAPSPTQATLLRQAGEALLQRLSPQERAALLLKDVFDMSLEESAQILGTSVGAIKAALHRARGRLRAQDDEPASERPRPSAKLVEAFVERLNASDLPGLLELMLDTGSVEALGGLLEVGREEFEKKGTWLWQSVHVHPELPDKLRPTKWENQTTVLMGEPVMLSFSPAEAGGERLLQSVTRFEERDGGIAQIRAYYLCPETMREVGQILGLPVGATLYRVPF